MRWKLEHTAPPADWSVQGGPQATSAFEFKAGQELKGTLSMVAPEKIEEGAFLETRLSLIDDETGQVIQQREWFQVYDTIPPDVSNYRVMLTTDHRVAIEALVGDTYAVLEATGVQSEYLDGWRTDLGDQGSQLRPRELRNADNVRDSLRSVCPKYLFNCGSLPEIQQAMYRRK